MIRNPALAGRGLHPPKVNVAVLDTTAGANGADLRKANLAGSRLISSFNPGAVKPARIGALKKFVEYLLANGLIGKGEDLQSVDVHRSIQKYAYIAEGMGMRLGYDFDFLESGAFSTEMSLDLYRLNLAKGGAEPFDGNARASADFLRLVEGKGTMWLRVATFVLQNIDTIRNVDEFARYMERESSIYDKRTVRSAFEQMHSMNEEERCRR